MRRLLFVTTYLGDLINRKGSGRVLHRVIVTSIFYPISTPMVGYNVHPAPPHPSEPQSSIVVGE